MKQKKVLIIFSLSLFFFSSFQCYSEVLTQKEIKKLYNKWDALTGEPNLAKIRYLVDQKELPINWIDENGVECGIFPSVINEAAAGRPNIELDKSSLSKEEIKERDEKRWDIVRYLLSKNASLCLKREKSSNLSKLALDYPNILEQLLERGDDPNRYYIPELVGVWNDYEFTAIKGALYVQPPEKRYQVMEMLLKHGASATNLDVTIIDEPEKYIPIVLEGMDIYREPKTSIEWRLKIVKLLIRYGANIQSLTYTKEGKKQCNYQANIFERFARQEKEPEMIALWEEYNTNNPHEYCTQAEFWTMRKKK